MNFDAMFTNKPEDIVVELFGKEYVVPGDPDIIKALKAERLLKQVMTNTAKTLVTRLSLKS